MPWINTRYCEYFYSPWMKHIISRVLWLPSREWCATTIPPSRPAPPHFEPPPRLGWGWVGPAAQRGCLQHTSHHPSPRPHRLPANSLPGFIFLLCCTASGWRGCLSWGQMKLIIRSCVYVAIFHKVLKCSMDLIFCGFHLQHIYTRIE